MQTAGSAATKTQMKPFFPLLMREQPQYVSNWPARLQMQGMNGPLTGPLHNPPPTTLQVRLILSGHEWQAAA